jgi:hypothetical protein
MRSGWDAFDVTDLGELYQTLLEILSKPGKADDVDFVIIVIY